MYNIYQINKPIKYDIYKAHIMQKENTYQTLKETMLLNDANDQAHSLLNFAIASVTMASDRLNGRDVTEPREYHKLLSVLESALLNLRLLENVLIQCPLKETPKA